jgi:hypothetical protein
MDNRKKLLKAIEQYALLTGLSTASISRYAVNNCRFYKCVFEGKNYTMNSYEKVMFWIKKNPAKNHKKRNTKQ